ncbi:MAG: DUF2079 domain-containing protein [Thermaerobacter sp.]|nr:DUF2079 domain-containing protein [Thermaerobacter sp.]
MQFYPAHNRHEFIGTIRLTAKPQVLLLLAVVVFGTFQLLVSIHKLDNLEATMMDLGDFEQEFWKISHGNWWAFSTVFQTPAFANDGSIYIYPLAYGFRYLGGALFLFLLQALGTAFAAWGIYRAAILNHLSEWHASIVAVLFLLYPAIIGGSQFDFHPDFLALPFLVWAYASGRKATYYVLLLMAALSKNMALISIAGWGLGLIFYRKQLRDGLIAFLSSVALFFIEMDVIFPRYFHGGTEKINLSLYEYLGHSFSSILTGIVVHFPLVLHHLLQEGPYALWIFGPVLALSLFGSASVLALCGLFFLNALSMLAAQQTITDQYQVILAGWVFLALGESLSRFRSRRSLFLFGVGLSTLALEAIFLASSIIPLLNRTCQALPQVENAVRHIPKHAVVWTQDRLGPEAYRFKVVGIAKEQVPGQFIDSLRLLWKEAGRGQKTPTAILAMRPVSPYLAEVIADALHAGYRVSFHQGPVFVVSGSRHFPLAAPSAVDSGWQPQGATWMIPAWTQATDQGSINWHQKTVLIPGKTRGTVLPGVLLQLGPGVYQVDVAISDSLPIRAGHRVLGALFINHRRQLIVAGATTVQLDLALRHPQVEDLRLTAWGDGAFAVHGFYIKRIAAN